MAFEMENAGTHDEEAFDSFQREAGVPEAREGSEVDVDQVDNSQQDARSKGRGSAHNIIDLTGGQIQGESGGGMSSSLLNVTPDAESSTEKRRKSAKRLNNSTLNES